MSEVLANLSKSGGSSNPTLAWSTIVNNTGTSGTGSQTSGTLKKGTYILTVDTSNDAWSSNGTTVTSIVCNGTNTLLKSDTKSSSTSEYASCVRQYVYKVVLTSESTIKVNYSWYGTNARAFYSLMISCIQI